MEIEQIISGWPYVKLNINTMTKQRFLKSLPLKNVASSTKEKVSPISKPFPDTNFREHGHHSAWRMVLYSAQTRV